MERDAERKKALEWWNSLSFQERKAIAYKNSKMTSIAHFHSSPLLITRAFRKFKLNSSTNDTFE